MQAVIIAGGEGTRLRPLTSTTPKPLLPVANRPMIARVVDLLVANGIDDIIVTVAYLGSAIRTYLGDGTDWGARIRYLQEESPLGTAGAVRNARHLLEDTFIVLSGDVVTTVDLEAARRFHHERGASATMVLTTVPDPTEFGVVATEDSGAVTRLIEKPSWGEVFTDTVNTGVYILEPSVLDRIPANRAVDFSEEVFPQILDDRGALFGYVADGYWADVGTFSGFHQTHHDVLDGRAGIAPSGFELAPGVYVGDRSTIDPSALLEAPCIVGNDVRIGPGSRLGPYTVVGHGVRVGSDVHLDGTIVFDHAWIADGARLGRAIVGRGVDIRRRVNVHDGAVLADGVLVGRDAVVRADIRVYPGKTVDPLATVANSIVWESGASRTVFGPLGISGLANVDINPEMATRIAMALASQLPNGAVLAARDTSRAARIIKRAMMVGFNAVGLDVWDLEATTTPVLRHAVAATDAVAGVRVALDADDPQALTIELLGAEGADLVATERRKVERALEREEFRRVSASEIGDLVMVSHATDRWKAAVTALLDIERIRERAFKLVLDYSYGVVASSLPQAIASFHADVLATHAYPSTARLIRLRLEEQIAELGRLVRGAKADLGAIVNAGGERLLLTDARGRVVPIAGIATILAEHLVATGKVRRLVASAAVASSVADTARALGIEFAWCGLSRADLAAAVADAPGTLAIGHSGLVFYSGCASSSDAAVTLGLILEALATTGTDLAHVIDRTPAETTVAEAVPVPYAVLGATMRGLRTFAEEQGPVELVATDGLRAQFQDRFWLLSPDPQEPVVTVIVGAADPEVAKDDLAVLRTAVAARRDEATQGRKGSNSNGSLPPSTSARG